MRHKPSSPILTHNTHTHTHKKLLRGPGRVQKEEKRVKAEKNHIPFNFDALYFGENKNACMT